MGHQALNNEVHKSVRVINRLSPSLGDNVGFSHVFPAEFAAAQGEFPIVVKQSSDDSVSLEIIALYSLEAGKNLFLTDQGWQASYLPLTMQRAPFLIGFEQTQENGIPKQNPVVHIDMDHPKVVQEPGGTEGEALFLEHGGTTEFLNHKSSVLMGILEGKQQADSLLAALTQYQLLEPLSLSVTFDNGEQLNVSGLMTINEEVLKDLSKEVVADLHEKQYLAPIYMMLASLTNVRKLVELRNQQTATF